MAAPPKARLAMRAAVAPMAMFQQMTRTVGAVVAVMGGLADKAGIPGVPTTPPVAEGGQVLLPLSIGWFWAEGAAQAPATTLQIHKAAVELAAE